MMNNILHFLELIPAATKVWEWITSKNDVIAQAAKATERKTKVRLSRQALIGWTSSSIFAECFTSIQSGCNGDIEERVIKSFRDSLQPMRNPAELKDKASTIVEVFFQELITALLRSKDAMVVHDTREEERLREVKLEIASLRESLPLTPVMPDNDLRDTQYNTKLDVIRNLFRRSKFETAFKLLEELDRDATGSSASDRVQFRVVTGLGHCALIKGDVDRAVALYKRAFSLRPKEALAVANRALASLLEGDLVESERIVSKGLDTHSRNVDIVSVYIQVLASKDEMGRVEDLFRESPELLDNSELRLRTGIFYSQKHDWESAQRHLDAATKLDHTDWRIDLYYGISVLAPIAGKYKGKALFGPDLASEDEASVEHALQALDRAVSGLRDAESREARANALANRAAAKGLLGDLAGAEKDCLMALEDNPSDYLANRNAGMIALEKGRPEDAERFLRVISENSTNPGLIVPLAISLMRQKKFRDAIVVLDSLLRVPIEDNELFEVGHILISAYSAIADVGGLRSLLLSIDSLANSETTKLAIRVCVFDALQDEASKRNVIDTLLTDDVAILSRNIALHMADILYRDSRFIEAAKVYKLHLASNDALGLQQRYVTAMYNARQYSDAYNTAHQLRGEKRALPVISEIEAAILEGRGDILPACELYEALVELQPDEIEYKIRIVECRFRMLDRERAAEYLRQVLSSEAKLTPPMLMRVAELQVVLDVGDPLVTLHKGLEGGWGDASIELGYFANFQGMYRLTSVQLNPIKVSVGDWVIISEGGQESEYHVVAEGQDRGRDDVAISSEFGQLLSSCAIGEEIPVHRGVAGRMNERTLRVVAIESEYVRDYRYIGMNFDKRHLGDSGLQKVNISENAESDLRFLVHNKSLYMAKIREMYEKGILTLGACAQITKDSLIDVWSACVSLNEGIMHVSEGTSEELSAHTNTIHESKAVVMDLTSLLSVVGFELQGGIHKVVDKIFIPQSVVDDVSLELANYKLFGVNVSMVLGMRDGEYIRQDLTTDDHNKQLMFYERLLQFCSSKHCEVTATTALSLEKQASYERSCDAVGRSSIDAVFSALYNKVPLYSDDLFLRNLARNEFGLQDGISTLSLTDVMYSRGGLSKEEYFTVLRRLILSNYFYVKVPDAFILWVLQGDQMQLTDAVRKVIGRVLGPACDSRACAHVASLVIKKVWLSDALLHSRSLILDFLCRTLVNRVDGLQTLAMLRRHILKQFDLYQKPLPEILGHIDLWKSLVR